MTALLLLQATALLLFTAMAWAMPSLAQATLPFGVRVPRERAGEPAVTAAVRPYRRRVMTAGAAVTASATGVLLLAGRTTVANAITPPCAAALLAGLDWAAYYRAHRAVAAAKAEGGWYDDVRQGVAVDISIRTDPERFPWLWALPSLLVTAATAVAGALRYPSLPATLTTHWNAAGRADGHVRTTVAIAFTPVFLQIVSSALLAGTAVFALRSRQSLDAERPRASAAQHRAFVRWTTRGLLVLAASVDLSLLGTALITWEVYGNRAVGAVAIGLPILAGVAFVFAVAVRTGAQGSRLPISVGEAGGARVVNRDDDRYWKGGLIYVNRDDSSVFVPKRFGIGWTVNFGRPAGILALLALTAVSVGLAVGLTH
ncbi:DUF5808 domain-containing protein [Streptomyces sp. NBC_01340]|uniref:DUF1648 domain-containing protein n=1 Tax=unclassified Streptomyces TaxID=2593676 RepID=UPI00224F1CA5|nr:MULTISPECIES: DUF5808 domain-containing protein [unclassified Streptomyces]MCX4458013.1 DUF5808 domain-containing protein [Streptomyces sp. NBC_01719]MCX4497370.1 DUF5808 domain-containing protein [Streptomyces sp. NBC_01728]WSI42217.1 DUF5808 domain-containing protein [Streptomyces sp. NBC_01340]